MYELIKETIIGTVVLAVVLWIMWNWWKKNTISGNLYRLKHGNSDVKKRAADALGKLGDKRSVEPLMKTLNDNLVGLNALAALSQIDHPASNTITHLARQLRNQVPEEKVPKMVLTAKKFAEEGYSFRVAYQKEEGYFKHHEESGYWDYGNHWNGLGGTPGAVDEWVETPAWDEWIVTVPEKLEINRGEKLEKWEKVLGVDHTDTIESPNNIDQELSSILPVRTVDLVHFAVTAPDCVPSGASFVIDVWAYLEHQYRDVVARAKEESSGGAVRIKSKGPLQIARGTILTVRLTIDQLVLRDGEDTIFWEGEVGNASFAVIVPENTHEGSHLGTSFIYLNGLRIARIDFIILVGQGSSDVTQLPATEKRFRKAFASYASGDRDAVLARVQGILKAAPQLEIFLDVLKMRSGVDWQKKLWQEIPLSDIFYLFWSGHAASSEWVEKEWRCALDSKGLDFIDPVPLVSPDDVPPPPELSSKHFNDWTLAYMRTKGSR